MSQFGGITPVHMEVNGTVRSFPSRMEFIRCAKEISQDLLLRAKEPATSPSESVHSFITRHFGDFAANSVIEPICRARFGASASHLSMAAAFPDVWAREGRSEGKGGSVLLSAPVSPHKLSSLDSMEVNRMDKLANDIAFNAGGVFTLKHGGATRLVNEIAAEFAFHTEALAADGAGVFTNTPVTHLTTEGETPEPSLVVKKVQEDGAVREETLPFGAVVLATHPHDAAALISPTDANVNLVAVRNALLNLDISTSPVCSIKILPKSTDSILSPSRGAPSYCPSISYGPSATGLLSARFDGLTFKTNHKEAGDDLAGITLTFGAVNDTTTTATTSASQGVYRPSAEQVLSVVRDKFGLREGQLSQTTLDAIHSLDNVLEQDANQRPVGYWTGKYVSYGPKFIPTLRELHDVKKATPWLEICGSGYHGESFQECLKDGRASADSLARRLVNSWTTGVPLRPPTDEEVKVRGALRMQK